MPAVMEARELIMIQHDKPLWWRRLQALDPEVAARDEPPYTAHEPAREAATDARLAHEQALVELSAERCATISG